MGYTVKDGELILTNGVFIRRMEFPEVDNRYLLKEYRPIEGEFAFLDEDGEELSFLLDGITYSGATGWKLLCVE